MIEVATMSTRREWERLEKIQGIALEALLIALGNEERPPLSDEGFAILLADFRHVLSGYSYRETDKKGPPTADPELGAAEWPFDESWLSRCPPTGSSG
jgi:hypothetical protein